MGQAERQANELVCVKQMKRTLFIRIRMPSSFYLTRSDISRLKRVTDKIRTLVAITLGPGSGVYLQ